MQNISYPTAETLTPPGVIISHLPNVSGRYVGSPSIAILSDGSYVASHDLFGLATKEHNKGEVWIFRSHDSGRSWNRVSTVSPAFWSGLFVHNNQLYLIGTTSHHGQIVIRRSIDSGSSWTQPLDSETGLLTENGEYHTAPTPVIQHRGRLWRAMEDATNGVDWPIRYRPIMLSAPVNADLLSRSSWTMSRPLNHDLNWLNGKFHGWLEGNAVVTPEGDLVDILRIDYEKGSKAALVSVGQDSDQSLTFDPQKDLIKMPGGAIKFTIRRDSKEGYYWALVNDLPSNYDGKIAPWIRNTLTLIRSRDLRHWEHRGVILHHPDSVAHGFQYPDWLFDGDDMVAVVRTAYDHKDGGATTAHDANYLTFHRIANFREYSDCVMGELASSTDILYPHR